MLRTINNYKIKDHLFSNPNLNIYRVIDENNNLFILKKINNINKLNSDVIEFNSEYEIISLLKDEEITLNSIKIEKSQDGYYSVFDDFNGITLTEFIENNNSLNLDIFYTIAINLCNIIKIIHQYGYIHKNINPNIILINTDNYDLKIIDFTTATKSEKEQVGWKDFSKKEKNTFIGLEDNNYWQELKLNLDFKLDGDVRYISPERTGRVNRSVDYRTDFYSLGIIFYSFFNKLPFNNMDILNIIHFHLADSFVFGDSFPFLIKEIIKKLTYKMTEDRYQTIFGLKYDLEQWFNYYKTKKEKIDFKIAEKDISNKFTIQEKLYGRENEVKQIINSFNDFLINKENMLVLISGYSGIGKTSLVKEIGKTINENKVYFIKSKYDQYNKNIPFSAIIEIFKNLLKIILTESDEELKNHERKLIEGLGKNAKIITDIIPELEFIIGGPQDELIELSPQENANRFYKTFQVFIEVFASEQHPLVIFLDDLQWSDISSLKLIENLLTDKEIKNLFIILAYRDNEINSTHPFQSFINQIIEKKIKTEKISLKTLKQENIKNLLEDSLYRSSPDISEIAITTLLSTNGNPFFINVFLKEINENELIFFDNEKNQWDWRLKEIKQIRVSDNVVDLIIDKILKLNSESQEILKLASCIGNVFDLGTLATINKKNVSQTAKDIENTFLSEMITPIGNAYKLANLIKENVKMAKIIKYKFQHDKIQEASYTLLDKEQKAKLRLEIAYIMYYNEDKKEENLFDMVNHFNAGRKYIGNVDELKILVNLNLQAGKKAKISTAYQSSGEYLEIAKNILLQIHSEKYMWENEYSLAMQIMKEYAEVEYLNGKFENSEKIIKQILTKANNLLDQSEAYNQLMIQYSAMGEFKLATENIRTALKPLDVFLPEKDFESYMNEDIKKIDNYLKNRTIMSLFDLPRMSDPIQIIKVKLLMNTYVTAYNTVPELASIISLKLVNLYLEYGNLTESWGYSSYTIHLITFLEKYKEAYDFSLLSMKISQRYNDLAGQAKAANILANYANPWVKPIKESDMINKMGIQSAINSGEFLHGSYSALHYVVNSFYQGKTLRIIENECIDYLSFSERAKNWMAIDTINGVSLAIFNLLGKTKNHTVFNNSVLTEEEYDKFCQEHQSLYPVGIYKIIKFEILYIYEEYEKASILLKEIKKILPFIAGINSVAEFNFYCSLVLCSTFEQNDKEEALIEIEQNQRQMKIWADNCPENYLHKYLLIEAELANLRNENWQAMELYNKAIMEAKKNGFIQNLAIAYDLAGKFFYKNANFELAQRYFFSAYENFEKWGAINKIELLRKKYPNFILSKNTNSLEKNNLFFENTDSLDFKSILKSSSIIAGEIKFENLLHKMMNILIENTGAERGVLFIKTNEELYVEIEAIVGEENNNIIKNKILVDDCESIPKNLINYVERTKDHCVIPNALDDIRFNKDNYIKNNKIKSVLCSPIIKQGDLIGIIYLENNLAENNFTEERLELIKILSAQAAISIDNAILYSNLEQRVVERTEQLAEKNKAITDSINYAKHIQYSLLPPQNTLSNNHIDVSVLFKPKDIVSGDFYWHFEDEDNKFLIIGDCTGHGVPGAFLSMIGIMLLNQIIKEMKIYQPSLILKTINSYFEKLLKQNENNFTNDSIEICICKINKNNIIYAGSRPLYYLKNKEIITIKGQTIQEKIKNIHTDHEIEINKQDKYVIYLTSDGIQDQHDSNRKKITSKGFLEIINKYKNLSSIEQKNEINKEIEKHQQNEKQTDDITLICAVIHD